MHYLQDTGRYNFKPILTAKIAIFTGAGLSAESGLSTFRDKDGLWEKFDINEICNIHSYTQNKLKVLSFYNARKQNILNAQPNDAHKAIAKFQKEFPNDVFISTSNIDDLLEKAGCTNVLHVHGDVEHLNCTYCFHRFYIGSAIFDIPADMKCPSCGRANKLKPGVTFFGEQAPAYEPLLNGFASDNIEHRILIGSTLKVNPPEFFSLDLPGKSYYLDKSPSKDYLFDEIIEGNATITVPNLLNRLRKELLFK